MITRYMAIDALGRKCGHLHDTRQQADACGRAWTDYYKKFGEPGLPFHTEEYTVEKYGAWKAIMRA